MGEVWGSLFELIKVWVLAVSCLFLFMIFSVVFWGNLLLLRELGVLIEQGLWAATDEAQESP